MTHPTVDELIEKYGPPDDVATIDDVDNPARVTWAHSALATFRRQVDHESLPPLGETWSDTDAEDAIADLIADLLHLATFTNCDPVDALDRGWRAFKAEVGRGYDSTRLDEEIAPGWTVGDSAAASAEGWDLFACSAMGHDAWELERLDDGPLPDDPTAWALVLAGAAHGNPLHLKALAFLRDQAPAEHAYITSTDREDHPRCEVKIEMIVGDTDESHPCFTPLYHDPETDRWVCVWADHETHEESAS